MAKHHLHLVTDSDPSTLLDRAADATFAAMAALQEAAEHFDQIIKLATNPETPEEAEALRGAVHWREDIAVARRALAGRHRLVSS